MASELSTGAGEQSNASEINRPRLSVFHPVASTSIDQPIDAAQAKFIAVLKVIRPHHWTKNSLVFIPFLLSHDLVLSRLLAVSLAFVALSLCASAIYIVNDLLDIDSDRRHPVKRNRPFAAGVLSQRMGLAMAGALVTTGLALSIIFLPPVYSMGLGCYFVLANLYSFRLKQYMAIDVILLSSFYALRVLLGGFATEIPISEWLIAFSMFLFLSLALVKRYSELSRLVSEGHDVAPGRGYQVKDLAILESLGPTSSYMSVLVFALYINSETTKELYVTSWPLWIVCLVLLYWTTRLWLLARRGDLTEDPVVFALTDRCSQLSLVATVVCVTAAAIEW